MSNIQLGVQQSCQKAVIELPRRAANETHLVIEDSEDLLRLFTWARRENYYLGTMVVSDERVLEDYAFKLYYVLSAPLPQNELVILEYTLRDPAQPTLYPSIRSYFASVEWLEREARDTFGLRPNNVPPLEPGFMLHAPVFPENLYPLRPRRSLEELTRKIKAYSGPGVVETPSALPGGMLELPVGPIHAGVIETGHFCFHLAGEVIETLTLQLGYKHKGIEKLFEAGLDWRRQAEQLLSRTNSGKKQKISALEMGWYLAERVSGDSSFAHALAYCQAVEDLAGITPPEPALDWRGLGLELERIYNHIGDVAALVHDMAFDLIASELAVLREQVVRLNERLSGHRLLRGLNRPGGIILPHPPDLAEVEQTIDRVTAAFLELSKLVLEKPACRDRAITTGILSAAEVKACGATGLTARAAGLWWHDFRLKHPCGIYTYPEVKQMLEETIVKDGIPSSEISRQAPIFEADLQGDVFARLALRVAEVETSAKIVTFLAQKLAQVDLSQLEFVTSIESVLPTVANFEFGLGYVEGWRGEIIYFVIKGPDNTIFRCKVRDPSLFNWPALGLAVQRKPKTDSKGKVDGFWENILADFPLINKSFNLSYAGHDL